MKDFLKRFAVRIVLACYLVASSIVSSHAMPVSSTVSFGISLSDAAAEHLDLDVISSHAESGTLAKLPGCHAEGSPSAVLGASQIALDAANEAAVAVQSEAEAELATSAKACKIFCAALAYAMSYLCTEPQLPLFESSSSLSHHLTLHDFYIKQEPHPPKIIS